ncbi:MAG: galactose mutarotase, partial [Pseudomonadota bacterium]
AKTDALTLINLAHHGVWNLDGRPSWDGHRLLVESDLYLPMDTEKIPLGETAPVAGTAFDHRALAPIDPGLDHNFCFEPTGERRRLARLVGPSGRALEVVSNAPGLQVYAGGVAGIALEPQLWPDAPHHPAFPSILLQPGMEFSQVTLFRLFSPK